MKIKPICIFIVSLILILSLPLYAFAEIDVDMGEDLDEDESTSSSQTIKFDSTFNINSFRGLNSVELSEEGLPECEHQYVITGFDADFGLATITCSVCGDSYNDLFVTHLSTQPEDDPEYDPVFDVIPDGVINAKDYAYLVKKYYSDYDYSFIKELVGSSEFEYKEKFMYVYITVLFVVSTGCICICVRRRD